MNATKHLCHRCDLTSQHSVSPSVERPGQVWLHCPYCGWDSLHPAQYAIANAPPPDHGEYEDSGRLLY